MDSPFNRGFGPGHQSPALSQAPPPGSAYQFNVNRTKTKKWVEARVQSYDGDDWGVEEYDEDRNPPPEPELAQKPPRHRPGAGADHLPPSPPVQAALSYQPRSLPVATHDPSTAESPVDWDKLGSPHSSDAPHPSFRTDAPSGEASAPLVRPSDVYRRMEEENQRQRALETDTGAILPGTPSKTNTLDSPDDRGAESRGRGDAGRQDFVSPQLPDVARMSTFGVHLFETTGSGITLEPAILEHGSDSSASPPPPRPQNNDEATPALARDSALPSPATPNASSGPARQIMAPRHVNEAESREESAEDEALSAKTQEHGEVEASSSVIDRAADQKPSSPTAHTVIAHPQARRPDSHLGSGWPTIPPLRTPSPRTSSGDVAGQASVGTGGPTSFPDNRSAEASGTQQHTELGHRAELSSIRRHPTTSTIGSSPVKDSDTLSDEILKSLSPAASSSADPASGDGRKSFLVPNPNAVRDSSYTLRDYDSYWADTSSKPQPVIPATNASESSNVAGSPAVSTRLGGNESAGGLDPRQRFSWEADEGPENPLSPDSANASATAREIAASPRAPSGLEPTQPSNGAVGDRPPNADDESPEPAKTTSGTLDELGGGQELQEVPVAPSPLSTFSDRRPSVGRDSIELPPANEGARVPDSSSIISIDSPPRSRGSPAVQPPNDAFEPQNSRRPAHAPSMTFREILSLPVPAERIVKYNETREYFAAAETGLKAWLENLQAQNPEYANDLELLSAAASHPLTRIDSHLSSANAPLPAQQPYYQQYLNATAPSTSSTGRPRPGASQAPPQSTGSTFGHPSHQIGFKSKEFMHSAGKMGKGLLSKGKSKLRGSGDKGDSADFQIDTDPMNQRRSSWAFGLGARPRPVKSSTRAAAAASLDCNSRPSSSVDRRPHGEASIIPPLGKGRTRDSERLSNRQSRRYSNFTGSADRVTAGLRRLRFPAISGSGVTQGGANNAQPVAQDQVLDSWVVAPRHGDVQDIESPEHDMAQATASAKCGKAAAALQPRFLNRNDTLRRNSSFVELPPIRRNSTFGITTRAKRASRRFSLDDDDDREKGNNRDFSMIGDSPRLSVGPEESLSLRPSSAPQDGRWSAFGHVDNGISRAPGQSRASEFPRRYEESTLRASPLPSLGSFDAALTRLSPMFASPGLATGPWKLEESHLAEPLHTVTKHRPGTATPMQPMFYGYDKETGAQDPTFQRAFDVPPSSAQRWPDLFSRPVHHDVEQPRSHSQTRAEPDLPHPTPPLRGYTSNPRYRSSDPEVDASRKLETNRLAKQGLGIFKPPSVPLTVMSRSDSSQEPKLAVDESGRAENSRLLQREPPGLLSSAAHISTDQRKPGDQASSFHRRQSNSSCKTSAVDFKSRGERPPPGPNRPSSSSLLKDSGLFDEESAGETRKKARLSTIVNLASFRDMFNGPGTGRRWSSQITVVSGTDKQHWQQSDRVAVASPDSSRGLHQSSTASPDTQSPNSIGGGKANRDGRRSFMPEMISDLLGRRPAPKHEGRKVPQHAQSYSSLQARHQEESAGDPSHRGINSSGTDSQAIPRPLSSDRVIQNQGHAGSADNCRLLPSSHINRPPQIPASLLCPSPLGIEAPMIQNGGIGGADCQLAQGLRVVPQVPDQREHSRDQSSPPLPSQHCGIGVRENESSPYANLEGPYEAVDGVTHRKSSEVSRGLSITSEGKAGENQSDQQADSSREPGIGAAVSSHEASRVTPAGCGSRAQPTEPGQHRAGTARGEPNNQEDLTESGSVARLHDSSSATRAAGSHSTLGHLSADHSKRDAPHDPNLSASSQPVPLQQITTDATQAERSLAYLPHGRPPISGSACPQNGQEPQGAQKNAHDGHRWKGLKTRIFESETPVTLQANSKPDKRGAKTGSKLIGALKRISRTLESTRGGAQGRNTQEPTKKLQSRQPSPEKRDSQKAAHPMWTITPVQSQKSLPSGTWAPSGAAPPQAGAHDQASGSPGEPREQMQTRYAHGEPMYDQVAIPQGYQSVHGEGIVAPTAYNLGRHAAVARFARPQQAHEGQAGFVSPRSLQSPPMSQKGPLRHDSVSSLGGGSASPLGSVDEARGGGLGLSFSHHPSLNPLGSWQESRVDERDAAQRHSGLKEVHVAGNGQHRPSEPAHTGTSASTDGAALARQSQSPIPEPASIVPTRDKEPTNSTIHATGMRGTVLHSAHDLPPAGMTGSTNDNDRWRQPQGPFVQSDDSVGEHKGSSVAVYVARAAELDNTADRNRRSRPFETQEKMMNRPADEEDEAPQMNATSWPGKEWNPYGASEFADWREE